MSAFLMYVDTTGGQRFIQCMCINLIVFLIRQTYSVDGTRHFFAHYRFNIYNPYMTSICLSGNKGGCAYNK